MDAGGSGVTRVVRYLPPAGVQSEIAAFDATVEGTRPGLMDQVESGGEVDTQMTDRDPLRGGDETRDAIRVGVATCLAPKL